MNSRIALISTVAIGTGLAGWSVDELRRNHWNFGVVVDGHASLASAIPAGLAAGAVGLAAGTLLSRHVSPEAAAAFAGRAVRYGAVAAALGGAAGVATMLTLVTPDHRHVSATWRQQILGWVGPGVVAAITGAALVTAVRA